MKPGCSTSARVTASPPSPRRAARCGVTPHIAQNTPNRRSAIDSRATQPAGCAISQRIRQRIAEPFGWIKEACGSRQAKHRGCDRAGSMFTLPAAAYNLVRLPKLLAAT
jgi:hypothetical protein